MGTFSNVQSEQNIAEHFFGAERSVLTEHLDPMFPRTLVEQPLFTLLDLIHTSPFRLKYFSLVLIYHSKKWLM